VTARVLAAFVAGGYTLEWQAASSDGHPMRGRIAFTIAADAAGLPSPETGPEDEPLHHDPIAFPEGEGLTAGSPAFVIVRWLTFIAVLGVIGVVAFRLLVLELVRRRRAPDSAALLALAAPRAAALGILMALLLLPVAATRLYLQSLALFGPERALDQTALAALLGRTGWGWAWLLQFVAAGVAALALWAAGRRYAGPAIDPRSISGSFHTPHPPNPHTLRSPRAAGSTGSTDSTDSPVESDVGAEAPGPGAGWLLAAVTALLLAFTLPLSGHAAAVPEVTWLAILADALHVLAAGGWVGSLLAVVIVGVPAARRLGPERSGRAFASLVNAFSPTALVFAALLTATGVLSATFHLHEVAELWQSAYGRTLLLKLGALSLVFAAGAYNWRRVRPALGSDEGTSRLRRSASFELAVATVVLLVTAVLVATPPPVDPPLDPPSGRASTATSSVPAVITGNAP
jgi:putative copper export protein